MNKIDKSGILNRINYLKKRKSSGNLYALTEKQRYLYDTVKRLANNKENEISSSQIKKACGVNFDFNNRENVITDFCYNKTNKEDNDNKFLISPKRGFFQFVDFDWNNERKIEITWHIKDLKNTFTIGSYANGEFAWCFNELENHLKNY